MDDHSCAFYLILYAGFRSKEILSVKTDDIKTDLETGVRYILVNGTKTENAIRRLPISKHLIKYGVIDYLIKNNGLNIVNSSLSISFTKLLKKLNISS